MKSKIHEHQKLITMNAGKKLMLLSVMSIMTMSFMASCETKKDTVETDMDSDMDTIAPMVEEPVDTMAATDMSSEEVEHTDVVPSGTYTGTAMRVDAAEKEIYVETADGKILELYFTDATMLTKNGQTVTFDNLKQGGKVEVNIEKKGNRLEPKEVKIME